MSETRVLLGRVGGGTSLPAVAPEIVLTAAGAGSNNYNQIRRFDLNIDCADDQVARFALRSADWTRIYFAISLRLTNAAPGIRKQVLIHMGGLYMREFCHYPVYGYPDWRGNRNWFWGIPIYVNGVFDPEWRGRDNSIRNDAVHSGWGTVGQSWWQMRAWRGMLRSKHGIQRIEGHQASPFAYSEPSIAGNRYRFRAHLRHTSAVARQPLTTTNLSDDGDIWPEYTSYFDWGRRMARDAQGMTSNRMAEHASLLRVTLDHYGTEQITKLVTYDLFHPAWEADT